MTHPTTQDEKYTPAVQAAQVDASTRRINELMQAALDDARTSRARFYTARNRLAEIRNVANAAIYDVEGAHVDCLSRALCEIAELAGGDL